MSADDEAVLLEHRGAVSFVVFNRPDRMNALTTGGWNTFADRMLEADAEPSTTAIVVTGKGRAFSAGGDVSSMADKAAAAAPHPSRVRHDGLGLVDRMLEVEKPTVAMVNGPAVGIGATVALLCDGAVMARAARIGDTHVPLGIVAGDGAIAILPLLVGVHRAKELLLTGRMLDGAEAAAMSMVNAAVEPEELERAALRLAGELSAGAPYAVRATKLVINRVLRFTAEQMLETSFAYETLSMGLPEHRDALDQFLARQR